jgi:Right handed beta helix region/Pel9A-like, right handed beta helix region
MKAFNSIRLLLGAALLLTGLLASPALAQDYFVAPEGNDANPGTLEKPWKSPVKAAKLLKAGDTLYFRKGQYKCRANGTYGLAPYADGTKDKPITFKNYKNEHVRIDCKGSDWGVTSNGYNWIVFDGLDITNSTHYGMKLSAASGRRGPDGEYVYSKHVIIRNCEVHHTGMECIFACEASNLTVENCYLHDSARSHGIYLQVGCDNAVLRNITSVNNRGNSGTQLNGDGGSKGIKNALVERCYLSGNAQGYSLMNVKNSIFRNNLIFNNGYVGPRGSGWRDLIMWTKRKEAGTGCADNIFENNTFVDLVPDGHKLNNIVRSKNGTRNITFRNNIFVVRGKPMMRLESWAGFVFENNLLYNLGGGQHVHKGGKLPDFCKAKGLKESGTIDKDPMFVDIKKGDLRLKDGSPCIDAGVKTDAKSKVTGKGQDIGAREKGAEVRIGCKLPWKNENPQP